MAIMIHASRVHGEEIRLVFSDHVACAIDEKLVGFRLDTDGDVANMLFDDVIPKEIGDTRPFVLFFKKQNKKLLERAEKIVATSPNYIEGSKFLSVNANKCVVVPNCVSEDRTKISDVCTQKAENIRKGADGKTLCFACGRHVPYKGLEYLVRASKFLNDGFAINIAGRGPLTNKLKKISAGDKKINFLGKVTDEDLLANIIACDIFCFPSVTKNEAFGIALAEAMKFGKPAVTFTVEGSGVNYVSLNGVTGIEVENRNVIQYAKAIKRLSADKELAAKYGAAAKERVEALFTFSKFTENIGNLIEGL